MYLHQIAKGVSKSRLLCLNGVQNRCGTFHKYHYLPVANVFGGRLWGKMTKILLIEDEGRFVDELAGLLRDWGHDVDEALNPSEAERLLEQVSYNIIITDENFDDSPVRGSHFIIENIQLMRNAKVILLTGVVYLTSIYPRLSKYGVNILNKGDSLLIEELRSILDS